MRWLGLLCVLISFSCSPSRKDKETRTVFRYNETQGIATLDPAYARRQTLMWPVYQLYNRLLELDESLHIQPSLAKKYTVSANGLLYTFTLRQDVFFHDAPFFPKGKGRKMVASDVLFSFQRLLDTRIASPGAWIFNIVDRSVNEQGFKAINDSIFEIMLSHPFAAFAGMLAMPYCSVIPHEALETYGNDFRNHPIGTGPFMLKVWREGEKLVLVKNPRYFEHDSAGKPLPYLDAIAITFINDKQSEFLEFVKGNLDFLSGVQTAYKDELLTRNGKLSPKYAEKFRMTQNPYLNTEYLGFMIDSTKLPGNPLLNKKVRLAINYGFDRVRMLKYMRNNIGTPALEGIIPKGMPGYTENHEGYAYNPDLSRKLLVEAGYPNGTGLPEISLTTTADYLDLCEYIQHELSAICINLKIEVSQGATFRGMVANSKVQFFRASWIADYPDAENYLSLFYSPNFSPKGPNYTHYKNARYNALFDQALLEQDEKKRLMLYGVLNAMIVSQAVIVPLYYDKAVRFFPKTIKGFGGNPMNILTLKRVYKTTP